MTTTTSIAALAEKVAILTDSLKSVRDELGRAEFELIAALRERDPEEWARCVDQQTTSYKAFLGGRYEITVPVKREYDPDAFKAEFGETDPALMEFYSEQSVTVVKKAVLGAGLTKFYKDASLAARLSRTLLPPRPPKPTVRPITK